MQALITLKSNIKKRFSDTGFKLNEPMSHHTSFGIGGPCELMVLPQSAEALCGIHAMASEAGVPVWVIGNGSNLLVSDAGLRGLVIKTCDGIAHIAHESNSELVVGSGALLSKTAVVALKNGLTGLEFAHGIPGTMGGAVYMNAGAYGGEMKDVVVETIYCDLLGRVFTLPAEGHAFGYRKSFFSQNLDYTILSTRIRLEKGVYEGIRARMDALMLKRKTMQPLEYPSAGSVFKRPNGHFAGGLIEACGLKGYRIGGAEVSQKHAGFIINCGGASCDDVLRLIEHIQQVVFASSGISLECEIKRLGL